MDNGFVKLAKPSKESVFSTKDMKFSAGLYQQLNVHHTIQYISPFHIYFGRVNIGNEVLGSMLNNHSSTPSSVISAYWPIHGNVITAFAQGRISIGSVMF